MSKPIHPANAWAVYSLLALWVLLFVIIVARIMGP